MQSKRRVLWMVLVLVLGVATSLVNAHSRGNIVDEFYDLVLVGESEEHSDQAQIVYSTTNSTHEPLTVTASYTVKSGSGYTVGWKLFGLSKYSEEEYSYSQTVDLPPFTHLRITTRDVWQYRHYSVYRTRVYWCYEHGEYEYEIEYAGDVDEKNLWTDVDFISHDVAEPVSLDPPEW